MPQHAVAIELRAACDACDRPLPINGLRPGARCLWCGHDNAIEPQTWDHLLHEPLTEAAWMEPGESGLVTQVHHGRRYVLSYTPAALPKGKARRPRGEFAVGLLAGLVATAAESAPGRAKPSAAPPAQCGACGGAVPLDGSLRAVPCPFCGVSFLVPDAVWMQLHPDAAAHPWLLVVEPAEEPEEPTWAGDAAIAADGTLIYAATLQKGGGLLAEGPRGRPRWRRLDLGVKPEKLVFCVVGDRVWVRRGPGALLLDLATGQTVGELKLGALRDARQLLPLPDGRVLAVSGRCVRVSADGRSDGAWVAPEKLSFFQDLFRDAEPTGPHEARASRLAVGPDGGVWQLGQDELGRLFLARLDPQGRRRWRVELGSEVQPCDCPPQPGPDGAWVFVWGNDGARVLAFDDQGRPATPPPWGRFRDGAWDGVPRMLRTPNGAVVWDLWGKNRRFGASGSRGNTSARDADRDAAAWEASEPEDEEG